MDEFPMDEPRLRIGVATIGQAPRPDMVADLRTILGDRPTILEAGALDGLSLGEIRHLAPSPGEFPLITSTRTGSVVTLSQARVVPLIQLALDRLASGGAQIFVVLCTGEFPPFRAPGLILMPQMLIMSAVQAIGVRKLGVFPPLADQVKVVQARWTSAGYEAIVVPASPYQADELVLEAAAQISSERVDALVLDCQAYKLRHRRMLRDVLDCPILVPNSLIGHYLQELIV